MNSLDAWAKRRNVIIRSIGKAPKTETKDREQAIHNLRLRKIEIHQQIETLKQEHGIGYFDRQLIGQISSLTQLIRKREKELEARR
jgi:hypothetical protein